MKKLTTKQLEVISSNSGMKRYLTSLSETVPHTQRSWLYEGKTSDWVLNSWKSKLSQLEHGTPYERLVFQFDTSQLEKWGPQGGHKPISDLMEIVTAGFNEHPPVPEAFSSREWIGAKQDAIKLLRSVGCYSLRPASYSSVIDDMRARDTLESNSGWPLFTRRNKREVILSSIHDAESGKWREYPAIALFRNYNGKTRLVWMYPMATNLVEGSFFQVIFKKLIASRLNVIAPWIGFDHVRYKVTELYSSRENVLLASDFSATDEHFTINSTLEVAEVLEQCFQKQYRQALRESLMHMHRIPLVISATEFIDGLHGVSSGSNWTNFVETIFDIILGFYVARITHNAINCAYAIGDDMLWVQRKSLNIEIPSFSSRLGVRVGQVINPEKLSNSQNKVKTLQRLFVRGEFRPDGTLRAVYPTIRALNSSIFPERFHSPAKWSADMFSARQFMILENCVDHPLFEDFVKFVCKGNRHLIPFAKKSRHELDKITRESKLLPGLNPSYNQERKDTSLSSFTSIQLASKL
nr:RNA-dependent RNA polymerase [Chicken picobirnavirus]